MTRISTVEIEAIRNRLENATEGTWKVYEKDGGIGIGTSWEHPQLRGPLPVVTLGVHFEEPSRRVYINDADAEFIANAREDIPKLLAEVARLETAIQDAISIAEMYREDFTLEPWCSLLNAVSGGDV